MSRIYIPPKISRIYIPPEIPSFIDVEIDALTEKRRRRKYEKNKRRYI